MACIRCPPAQHPLLLLCLQPLPSTSHSSSQADEHHSSLISLLTVLVMALGALHLGGSKAGTKRRGKGGERRFLRTPARQGHRTKRPHDSARDAVTESTQEQRACTKDHGKRDVFLLMRPISKTCSMRSLAKETPIACLSRGLRYASRFLPFKNGPKGA